MRLVKTSLACVLFVLAGSLPAIAADYYDDLAGDHTQLEEKLVALAEAIPEDKYSWRPASGVRSVSEALMHAANAQYFFARRFEVEPPEGVDVSQLESITDKSTVLEALEASFAQGRKMLEAAKAMPLEEEVDVFGRKYTAASVAHAALSHLHEHLGQLIAYARSIDVTPPWSEG